jgi:hypothetical protein
MRWASIIAVAVLIFALSGGPVRATSVYRCFGRDGVVKFQDRPCQRDEPGQRIELPDSPLAPVAKADEPDLDPSVTPEPADSAAPIENPAPPGPAATLCTREDGSGYLSDSGSGERRAVPLGVLGIPGQSLADAYGGSNGIGVSAPGLRAAPSDRSRSGRLGALTTWVEDPCVRIDGPTLCAFLKERIVDAERRQRLAFSDTRAQVRSELESLRLRAGQCPR